MLTEGAPLLAARRTMELNGWERGPAALLAEGLGGGVQLSLATGSPRVSPDVSCREPGYACGQNPTAQPTGTHGLAGFLCGTGTASLSRASYSGPHPLAGQARPAWAVRGRGPSAQPRGPQGRGESPVLPPPGLAAVRARWEGPASSGQPGQDGPTPHHW